MTLVISQMRRPGEILDSSKLAVLSNKISGSIRQRTKGNYIAKSSIDGRTMKITIKQLNPETNKYVSVVKDEQEILAGRVSNFLNSNNIIHDIKVI